MRGPYKSQVFDILEQRRVPIKTILDVGILAGTPELIRAFPDRKHVLFEPIVEYTDHIANAYADIDYTLHSVAVAERSGEVEMRVESSVGTDWITHSYICQEGEAPNRTVPVIALDDFVPSQDLEGPFLLKIDVDGVELKILQGAKETLKNCSVVIVEADKSHLAERLAFMTDLGFELFDLMEPAYYDQAFWQCDLVFLRYDIFKAYFKDLTDGLDIHAYTIFAEAS